MKRGKPCDKRGDISFTKKLATCSQCSTACEHIYSLKEVPNCEECRSRSSIFPGNKGTQVPCKMQKTIEKAKVKYLPAEEVANLKSGFKTTTQVKRSNLDTPSDAIYRRAHNATKTATSKCHQRTENTSSGSTASHQWPVQKFSCAKSHCSFPSEKCIPESLTKAIGTEDRPRKPVAPAVNAKPSPHTFLPQKDINSCNFEFSPAIDKEPNDSGDGRSKRRAELGLNREKVTGNDFIHKVNPVDTIVPAKGVENSRGRMEYLAYGSASIVPMKPPFISSPGAAPTNPEIHERNSPVIQKYPPNGPALEIIWKGSFEVLDLAPDVGFCEGFSAHPPRKVSRKAYEFSKQIAGVLQFKMYPRCDLWPELFQTDFPDGNDIAFYFYPGKFERSKKKYSSLLKFIEKNDLVLKSQMGRVELLVFPSKLLHITSQKVNGSFFMWGVFRCLKKTT